MTARKNRDELVGADKYIALNVPRGTYRHLVKKNCVNFGCDNPINGIRDYERFGNYCQDCHRNAKVLGFSEKQMDTLFTNTSEDIFYAKLQKQVAQELSTARAERIMLEVV